MRILSHTERPDGYVVYETDDETLPMVAYPAGAFANKGQLIKEVQAKVKEMKQKKKRLRGRQDEVERGIDASD